MKKTKDWSLADLVESRQIEQEEHNKTLETLTDEKIEETAKNFDKMLAEREENQSTSD